MYDELSRCDILRLGLAVPNGGSQRIAGCVRSDDGPIRRHFPESELNCAWTSPPLQYKCDVLIIRFDSEDVSNSNAPTVLRMRGSSEFCRSGEADDSLCKYSRSLR